jgi:DNA adenine methylase
VLCNQGFSGEISNSWGYGVADNKTEKRTRNKRDGFLEYYRDRLEEVQIECTDALHVIKSRDRENSFFYCDPPYFNSDMGHYKGYTEEDFENLLIALSQIKGKFLLSSYPSDLLERYADQFGWHTKTFEMNLAVSNKGKKKIEVLTANYDINAIDVAE